ncbi:MAG: hypothetical protein ABJF01_01485 [bacterium]
MSSAAATTDPHDRIIDDYTSRAAQHGRVRDDAARVASRIGSARLLVFIAAAAGVAIAARRDAPVVAWSIGLIGSLVFVGLVYRHRRLSALVRLHDALRRSCDTGTSRIRREWSALPAALSVNYARSHPFAGDLHLSGETSLAQLLGPVSAAVGHDALTQWLLAESPPSIDALRGRQEAIGELRPLTDWRERLGVHAAGAGTSASVEKLLTWAESDGWLRARPGIRWAARTLGVVTPLAILAAIRGLIPDAVAIVLVVVNLLVVASARRRVNDTLQNASARGFNGRAYSAMFDHAHRTAFQSGHLRALQERMGGGVAAPALERLAQISTCADVRLSPMGHVVINALTLWDIHVVDALERWQAQHGGVMRDRLSALGELEAHSAVATLAYENPTWTFPAFRDDVHSVEGSDLAHPLLAASTRVANDVAVGPTGTFLLVTGSNMAGKSTLLRSIALNVVLAQAGAPVCASAFRLPRVRLRTSIHVHDALEDGLSLFMVELLRLKAIVDAAREGDDPPLLYVADEMLRGTNMQERRPAVAAVLRHLLRAGAIGAIATHDLELATEPELEAHARAVHLVEQFRETNAGPEMWFDYRVRPGIATSRNALKLLEMVGLGDDPVARPSATPSGERTTA